MIRNSMPDRTRLLSRSALAGLSLLLLAGTLSGCTTAEGTNALTDVGTFEREVATSTLQGLGVLEREEKDEKIPTRGRLALPKEGTEIAAPRTGKDSVAEQLPEDSDRVQINTTGMTEEDIKRLRNARVVDLRSLAGRPLTETEAKQLTARMTAYRLAEGRGKRPLYLPPEEYYTTVSGQDMVCLAANGDLVPVNDPACPPEIRAALSGKK